MHGNINTKCLGLITQEWTILLKYKKWDINDIFL